MAGRDLTPPGTPPIPARSPAQPTTAGPSHSGQTLVGDRPLPLGLRAGAFTGTTVQRPGGTQFLTRSEGAVEQAFYEVGRLVSTTLERTAMFGATTADHFREIVGLAKSTADSAKLQAKAGEDAARSATEAAKAHREIAQDAKAAQQAHRTLREAALPVGFDLNDIRRRVALSPGTAEGVEGATPGLTPLPQPDVSAQRSMSFAQGRALLERHEGGAFGASMMAAQWAMGRAAASRFGAPAINRQVDAAGKVTYTNVGVSSLAPGEVLNPAKAEHLSLIGQFEKGMARKTATMGALEDVAAGHSTIVSAALRGAGVAGVAGLAAGAGDLAYHAIQGQHEENRAWQQIYGGSNWGTGFSNRVAQQRFGLGRMLSGMNESQANALFMGVSQTGLRGGERQAALDFGTHEFDKWGLDVKDSVDLVRASIQGGVDDFGSLRRALDEVGMSAKQSGRNVNEAQRSFLQTYHAVSQTIAGTAGTQFAGALSAAQAGLPHGLSGVDLSGLGSSSSLRMAAASMGVSYPQLLGQAQRDPSVLNRAATLQFNRQINTLLTPDRRTQIQQLVRERTGGTGWIQAGQAHAIAGQLERSGALGGLDPATIVAAAQAYGVTGVTEANAYDYLVMGGANAIGGGDFGTHQAQVDAAKRKRDAADARTNMIRGQAIKTGGSLGSNKYVGEWNQATLLAQDLGIDLKQSGKAGTAAHEFYNYQRDYLAKTGKRSAVVEALIDPKQYDPNRRFTVQTSKGARTVDLHTALKFYTDQLEQGDVQIASGAGAGSTVAEVLGDVVNPDQAITSTAAGGVHGAQVKAGSRTVGAVRIEPSDALKEFFKFIPSGGAYLDTSRRSGIPAPSDTPVSDLPR